jgi:hypothetical protein
MADNICSICLDQLCSSEIGAINPCGHLFHRACFVSWENTQANKQLGRDEYNSRRNVLVKCPNCNTPSEGLVILRGLDLETLIEDGGDSDSDSDIDDDDDDDDVERDDSYIDNEDEQSNDENENETPADLNKIYRKDNEHAATSTNVDDNDNDHDHDHDNDGHDGDKALADESNDNVVVILSDSEEDPIEYILTAITTAATATATTAAAITPSTTTSSNSSTLTKNTSTKHKKQNNCHKKKKQKDINNNNNNNTSSSSSSSNNNSSNDADEKLKKYKRRCKSLKRVNESLKQSSKEYNELSTKYKDCHKLCNNLERTNHEMKISLQRHVMNEIQLHDEIIDNKETIRKQETSLLREQHSITDLLREKENMERQYRARVNQARSNSMTEFEELEKHLSILRNKNEEKDKEIKILKDDMRILRELTSADGSGLTSSSSSLASASSANRFKKNAIFKEIEEQFNMQEIQERRIKDIKQKKDTRRAAINTSSQFAKRMRKESLKAKQVKTRWDPLDERPSLSSSSSSRKGYLHTSSTSSSRTPLVEQSNNHTLQTNRASITSAPRKSTFPTQRSTHMGGGNVRSASSLSNTKPMNSSRLSNRTQYSTTSKKLKSSSKSEITNFFSRKK